MLPIRSAITFTIRIRGTISTSIRKLETVTKLITKYLDSALV